MKASSEINISKEHHRKNSFPRAENGTLNLVANRLSVLHQMGLLKQNSWTGYLASLELVTKKVGRHPIGE